MSRSVLQKEYQFIFLLLATSTFFLMMNSFLFSIRLLLSHLALRFLINLWILFPFSSIHEQKTGESNESYTNKKGNDDGLRVEE